MQVVGMPREQSISVTEFINTKYKEYWDYSNKNGKNSVDPREQLPEVVRKITYASYMLGVKEHEERKTGELIGETQKFHSHGPSSIEDSIKGVATAYKSQPSVRLLEGIGNFGAAPGDEGAAGRYTNISGTPLMKAIFKDMPFVPKNTEDTGLEQAEYISVPLPIALITGVSPIGTGRSCYIAEREAKEVIDWIDELRKNNWSDEIDPPAPMCVNGCKTWFNHENGFVYYDAVIHFAVDADDLTKKGKYDIITNLPPKATPDSVIYKLTSKLPTRASKEIKDGAGKGMPTCIIVPKGYITEDDYRKFGLRSSRQEQVYVWDHERETMRRSSLHHIAKEWFLDRSKIVTLRLEKQLSTLESEIHLFDLIKEFAEHNMVTWKYQEIVDHFVKLFPETGEEDAATVAGKTVKVFLPENLDKNEEYKKKDINKIKEIKKDIKSIGDVIIKEAYSIIEEQEKFFANL